LITFSSSSVEVSFFSVVKDFFSFASFISTPKMSIFLSLISQPDDWYDNVFFGPQAISFAMCLSFSTLLSLWFSMMLFASICWFPTAVKVACPLTFRQNSDDTHLQSTDNYSLLANTGWAALNVRYWLAVRKHLWSMGGHTTFSVIMNWYVLREKSHDCI
jgi:hypothetical protein